MPKGLNWSQVSVIVDDIAVKARRAARICDIVSAQCRTRHRIGVVNGVHLLSTELEALIESTSDIFDIVGPPVEAKEPEA